MEKVLERTQSQAGVAILVSAEWSANQNVQRSREVSPPPANPSEDRINLNTCSGQGSSKQGSLLQENKATNGTLKF